MFFEIYVFSATDDNRAGVIFELRLLLKNTVLNILIACDLMVLWDYMILNNQIDFI